jgi:hypothetical protein
MSIYGDEVRAFRRALLERTLVEHGGNKTKAAEALGLLRTQIIAMCRKLGVKRVNPDCKWDRSGCTCKSGGRCSGMDASRVAAEKTRAATRARKATGK